MEFLELYMYNLGDFITIIPYSIVKKNVKTEKKEISQENIVSGNSLEFKYNNNMEERQKDLSSFQKIFLITIVDFIAQIGPIIFNIINL